MCWVTQPTQKERPQMDGDYAAFAFLLDGEVYFVPQVIANSKITANPQDFSNVENDAPDTETIQSAGRGTIISVRNGMSMCVKKKPQ